MESRALFHHARLEVVVSILLLLAIDVRPASAQHHAVGEAWIYPDAPQRTQIHLEGDPLCLVEFQEQCFGGMMAPDSVLCELHVLPQPEWPEECPIAIECLVSDPDGHPMLDGSGMHGDMMRRDVGLIVHYAPAAMMDLGLDPSTMCLAIWSGARWVVDSEATHDLDAATFTLSTRAPTARYAVLPLDRVATSERSWGELKAIHRDIRRE